LVPESAEELGIPAVVRRQLDLGQFRLGIVAENDDTMGEMVPAGSVVVIDTSHHNVEMGSWKTIEERPIYFVWHEDGFSCSWCYMTRDTLFIVPYPTSHQPVMIFKTPRAATVIIPVLFGRRCLHWHDGDEIQKALLFRLCAFAVRSFFIDTKLVQETETTRQSGSKTARGS
jgi:hypothetical protein